MFKTHRKKILPAVTLLTCLIGTQAQAQSYYPQAPQVYRNTLSFDLSTPGGPLAMLAVSSNLAHAPVYSWRAHATREGRGSLGLNGKLIGYTDDNGDYIISVRLPDQDIYCGRYINETFAVGSPTYPRSRPLSFRIFRSADAFINPGSGRPEIPEREPVGVCAP